MDYKPHALLDKPLEIHVRPTRLHESLRMYLGYLVLGVICLSVTLLAFPMRALLPRALSKRLGRRLVTHTTRAYLHFLTRMGACRFDLSALDVLRDGQAMVIAPNHPCLLDAVMILSRLPDAACIMKAELVNSVFFGAGARLAGYIRNTPLRTMVQLGVDDLARGSHLLLFPEGTRTMRFPVGAMQGTTGLIAKKAGVPVQTVFIETDSGFLGKGWSLLWTPSMPITYRVRLGRRFDPPRDTAQFVRELEQYFQSELAHAQLPDFPVKAPPA
ncbi:MAG: lysophospholipid acyltransferase family protein [Polaromonas sp.]|nr:lysophospholipid acyltransferase family protein [Polaromonas sp.]